MLNLVGRKLSDIKIVPVDDLIDGPKRIDMRFLENKDRHSLFSYKGIEFGYGVNRRGWLCHHPKKGLVFVKSGGRFAEVEHFFKDYYGKRKSKKFFLVEIDDCIGKRIRDAVFFHEVREMYYRTKKRYGRDRAHEKAMADEKKYIGKFYNDLLKKQISLCRAGLPLIIGIPEPRKRFIKCSKTD